MEALNRHEQEAIAELLHHAGFVRLLDLLQASVASTLAEAEDESDPAKLLRTMRFWQFLNKVHGWLRTTPAKIEEELGRLRESGALEDFPTSRDDAWAKRWARPEPEPEWGDPASI